MPLRYREGTTSTVTIASGRAKKSSSIYLHHTSILTIIQKNISKGMFLDYKECEATTRNTATT